MAKPKYKKEYCDKVVEYFSKFLEMRDDPDESNKAEQHGMVSVTLEDGAATVNKKPSTGYPSLIKYAKKIGVTPRTLTNWRQKYKDFDEACEFADLIQDEVLNERALTGKCDGRVAMKIRELKMNARRLNMDETMSADKRFGIDVKKHINSDGKLELKEWDGEVVEDEGYKPQAD